jgi:branched-chain amino acid transport system substrate-binding protein
MHKWFATFVATFLLGWGVSPAIAQYQGGPIKIGVMNDQSGLYSDIAGMGSVWTAKKAVEDFGAAAKGMKVEIIAADHLNKPDVGSNIARQWYDVEKVDAIADVPTSSVALAVNEITREKTKVFLAVGPATSDLTGKACSPNTVHWIYDTWALANGTGNALVKQGGDTWFFLTADYAFGHALERDTEAVVLKSGGKVLGKVRHPFPGQDFSSFLLQAQASKAKVIGLANAGGDTINAIKQAAEFGIARADRSSRACSSS